MSHILEGFVNKSGPKGYHRKSLEKPVFKSAGIIPQGQGHMERQNFITWIDRISEGVA